MHFVNDRPDARAKGYPLLATLRAFSEAIKLSHTVFALPFALLASFLALRGSIFDLKKLFWIVFAMGGARTWAMAVNRVADASFDAENPRTAARAVASGKISKKHMMVFGLCGAVVFILSAAALSDVALWCALPVLLILASYSYTKRFTFLCHFWLGFCLGLAPLGAWVAIRDTLRWELFLLSGGITCWVGGFDIIYSTQDADFDRKRGLQSLPSRFGISLSLKLAAASHLIAALFFAFFGVVFDLGVFYFAGLCAAVALMIQQHRLVRKATPEKIDFAFFNLNGWIAVLLFLATALSLWLEPVLRNQL
jgi:4-hydroxybenzoate polyprenyltransferase